MPTYDAETDLQQIRIVIESLARHIRPALIALDLSDALAICDMLSRHLALEGADWTALAATSMREGGGESGTDTLPKTPQS